MGEKPFAGFSFCAPLGRGGVCGGPLTKGQQINPRTLRTSKGGPYSFKIQSGRGFLPPGLILNPRSGIISGTVSAQAQTRRWPFTVCTSTNFAASAKTAGSTCRPTAIDVVPGFVGSYDGTYSVPGSSGIGCDVAPFGGPVHVDITLFHRAGAWVGLSYATTLTLKGADVSFFFGTCTISGHPDITRTDNVVSDGGPELQEGNAVTGFTVRGNTLKGTERDNYYNDGHTLITFQATRSG